MISESGTGGIKGKIIKVSIELEEYLRLKDIERLVKDIIKKDESRDGISHRGKEEGNR
nr:MAG TPA: hypothetical protein [Bacteriophage sp.]